jgi:methionyl aminopeptidase
MQLTNSEIEDLREGGQKWLAVMQEIKNAIKVGTNLTTIEEIAERATAKLGAIPSFKGYQGYPAATCLSVNDEIVHCIPKDYTLQEGDIITVDFGVYYKGLHTDGAVTWGVGNISPEAKKLLSGVYSALLAGTDVVQVGGRVNDISTAIERVLKSKGLVIFKQFVGHGVGHKLHEEILIPNYAVSGPTPILKANTAVALEPIAGLGTDATVLDCNNGWDTRAKSGQPVAQFEHTILITDTGIEIMTPLETLIESIK